MIVHPPCSSSDVFGDWICRGLGLAPIGPPLLNWHGWLEVPLPNRITYIDPFMVHGGFSSQLLLMLQQIRRENQLRLVVYLTIYNMFFLHPRWWSPDVWTINSINCWKVWSFYLKYLDLRCTWKIQHVPFPKRPEFLIELCLCWICFHGEW